MDFIIAFCDGASNPHSKRSGIGIVFFKPSDMFNPEDGKTLKTNVKPFHIISEEIFSNKLQTNSNKYPTNNEAEYQSLIKALEYSISNRVSKIYIYMDSKLVVEQVNGNWNINYPHLQLLKNRVDELKKNITLKLKHVKRNFNAHADKASKNPLSNNKSTYFDNWKIS